MSSMNEARLSQSMPFGYKLDLECFASRNYGNLDHRDGAKLEGLGVWLGDYDDPHRVITGLSFDEEKFRYYKATAGASRNDSEKDLSTNVWHNPDHEPRVVCVACSSAGRESEPGMERIYLDFLYSDMERKVNSFPLHSLIASDNVCAN